MNQAALIGTVEEALQGTFGDSLFQTSSRTTRGVPRVSKCL